MPAYGHLTGSYAFNELISSFMITVNMLSAFRVTLQLRVANNELQYPNIYKQELPTFPKGEVYVAKKQGNSCAVLP